MIRISGNRQQLDELVAASGLPFVESVQVARRRRLNPTDACVETTYNLTVSNADGDSIPVQIDDALDYLRRNGKLIAELLRSFTEGHCVIDFSWDFPESSVGQYNTFPIGLTGLLHEYKIDLRVSVYSVSNDRANNPMQPSGEVGRLEVGDQPWPPVDR